VSVLASWTLGSHTANGVTHPIYRKGSGPGVIVIHEIPGLTPKVIAFAEEVVARGFTVVLPSLFGRPEAEATVAESLRSIASVCVSREFSMFAVGRTSSVATWLRSLAPVGKARRADLGISRADLESVKAKVAHGCQVLGLLTTVADALDLAARTAMNPPIEDAPALLSIDHEAG
jgi:hypothetical protein